MVCPAVFEWVSFYKRPSDISNAVWPIMCVTFELTFIWTWKYRDLIFWHSLFVFLASVLCNLSYFGHLTLSLGFSHHAPSFGKTSPSFADTSTLTSSTTSSTASLLGQRPNRRSVGRREAQRTFQPTKGWLMPSSTFVKKACITRCCDVNCKGPIDGRFYLLTQVTAQPIAQF